MTTLRSVLLALALIGIAAGVALADGPEKEVGKKSAKDLEHTQKAFSQAIANATKTLVTIETLGGTTVGSGKIFTKKGGPNRRNNYKQAIDVSTTGVIVRKDGIIATSNFNLNTKPQIITVILGDGREFVAKIVAQDHSKKLALLKIKPKKNDLPVARAAKGIAKGQWAIALGRAYAGQSPSAHFGIVSAVNRISGKAMQTDAPCSPVNYGGPLIDLQGDTLGIVVPLSTRGSGVGWYDSGIGFAIPLSDVIKNIDFMLKNKELHGGFLGVQTDNNYKGPGARVSRAVPNSAAAKAKLSPNDILLEVDGKKIHNRFDLLFELGRKYAGEEVKLKIKREGEEFEQKVTLGKRPKAGPRPGRPGGPRPPGGPGGPPR